MSDDDELDRSSEYPVPRRSRRSERRRNGFWGIVAIMQEMRQGAVIAGSVLGILYISWQIISPAVYAHTVEPVMDKKIAPVMVEIRHMQQIDSEHFAMNDRRWNDLDSSREEGRLIQRALARGYCIDHPNVAAYSGLPCHRLLEGGAH